jgi:acyl carrier protein
MSEPDEGFEQIRERVLERLKRRKSASPRLIEKLKSVTAEDELASIALDSLSRLEIVIAASEAFGVELRPSDCENSRTFGEVCRVLSEKTGRAK